MTHISLAWILLIRCGVVFVGTNSINMRFLRIAFNYFS